ncbi:MAG: NAD-dependent epimerase/dehydratase family protein [Flavisolibacter sp.]
MILVTGGTGFLGSYIIKNLIEKGLPVRALHRTNNFPFYIPKTIFEKVEWVQGDILDLVSLDDAMKNVDSVIHTAAIVSFVKERRKQMYQVNVEGTDNVVNLALENNVRRLIHISSIAALGRTTKPELVTEEKKWEANPNNTHYAISKHHAEIHAWRGFAEGLEGVVLNPSTILGYGDWHQSSCAVFKNAYRSFPWYTDGLNGFVGVEDVAEAAAQVLTSSINHKRFIVNADNWAFRKLFDTMADNFHKKRPHKEATRTMGAIAWRLEKLKSLFTGSKPLLTKETAKVAHSKTSFANHALLQALPGFSYTPLDVVIKNSCEKYLEAVEKGILTP